MSTKIALLLGNTLEERKKIYQLSKKFYTLRSKIVHEGGGKDFQKKLKKFRKLVGNVWNFSIDLVRIILLCLFDENDSNLEFLPKHEIKDKFL